MATAWKHVDWTRRDADLAREHNVTREAVRKARRRHAKGTPVTAEPTEPMKRAREKFALAPKSAPEGHASRAFRIMAEADVLDRFARMTPEARGRILTEAMRSE